MDDEQKRKARDFFEKSYAKIKKVIRLEDLFTEHGGCLPSLGLTGTDWKFQIGEVFKMKTMLGVRAIGARTPSGPFLIRERFWPDDPVPQIYIFEGPGSLKLLFGQHFEKGALDDSLSYATMLALMGEDPEKDNIGILILNDHFKEQG